MRSSFASLIRQLCVRLLEPVQELIRELDGLM